LATALQVRRREGREPLFSLDPKSSPAELDSGVAKDLVQVQRFEPAWLAGTSVGDVMFQADYHLKELSMGEHAQPITGMKSCFDMFREDGSTGHHGGWIAREWFVVRGAEMCLSDGNVLSPRVHMGVEARELVDGPGGVEDARLTSPDHPLVRYAEAFTHYFDLIAERKSVVHELREVAKACLVAKYLVESDAHLEDCWLSWANDACAGKAEPCVEIPQLWNERRYHQVRLLDGKMMDSPNGVVGDHDVCGVYGGVEMSLDRIELANLMVSAKKSLVVSATIPTEARAPQGVDLNLDKFCMSAPVADAGQDAGTWRGLDFVGASFWTAVDTDDGPLRKDERQFLSGVFHPRLSDRREDGDLFLPPSTDAALVHRLRELIGEEDAMRQRRLDHFRSTSFLTSDPGPLFPVSWAPSSEISQQGQAGSSHVLVSRSKSLQPRPDYFADAPRLLRSTDPSFDKSTEDGTRFRIYQISSLEVRTTQDHDGEESVCAVYSSITASSKGCQDSIAETERISKAKLYVERAGSSTATAGHQEWALGKPPPHKRFFTVLETVCGHHVLIELLDDGKIRWSANPRDLETRGSLARVVRVSGCHGVTVGDMMEHRGKQAQLLGGFFSPSRSKRVAQGAYDRASSA